MTVTEEIVFKAMEKAAKGHSDSKSVEWMMANKKAYASAIMDSIASGEYVNRLKYRKLKKTNPNGKERNIKSPDLFTFVLQHLFLCLAWPIYNWHDNYNGLNCKKGCGITSNIPSKSIIHRLKHLMYDRRDLHYAIIIDQRKCYEHIRPKIFRKEMRRLTDDRELIEFGINVGFVDNCLPIGTPTSPYIHHVVMLRFDHWIKQAAPFSERFADDNIGATYGKSDGNALKWRIQNFWWYEYQIRAKASTIRLIPLDKKEVSFCGYVVHRNPDRGIADHDKGYTTIRQNIRKRASRCNRDKSWASYYGILSKGDCFKLMQNIEKKMELTEITEKVRINRDLDADNIVMKDLEGKVFNIYEYDMRSDNKGTPNWIKCLIGIEEKDDKGKPTGNIKAYEFHGSYMGIVEFIALSEKIIGKKEMMPMRKMEVEDRCGWVFKGSTNKIEYIDEKKYTQTSLF